MAEYGICFARGFSMEEALAMIEDDEELQYNSANFVMLPPENACGDITDEDSGDENTVTPDNLSSSQLRAPAELTLKTSNDDDKLFEDAEDIPLAQLCQEWKNDFCKRTKTVEWKESDLEYVESEWNKPNEILDDISPINLFNSIMNDDIYAIILRETNNYCLKKNKPHNITLSELKSFFGVLVLSGYIQVPRRRMFWEREKDSHNKLVSDAISRDRFEYIMSNFHLVDNDNIDKIDKFAKVRSFFQHLNNKFMEFAPTEESHSVDEAMVPYYGRHGCKQYIHGKPIRFGYKLWVGCTRLGYINWVQPYQGASTFIDEKNKELGVGANVILTYVDRLRSKWDSEQFHLYFDNFFSSYDLLRILSKKNIRGTGTIRRNRIPNIPFKSVPEMKKTVRGTYEYKSSEDNILVLQWNDNSIVAVCSNSVGVAPTHNITRYSRRDKKSITVTQPNLIKLYNKNMGGVDRSDENIALYRTSIRGKKWYFPLVSHCIDMAVHNAWQLHKLNQGKLDHLSFRRAIAISLLECNKKTTTPFATGRPSARENFAVRYDRIDHFVIPQDKQTKCRSCHTKTTTRCTKCNVGLHVKCFVNYHTV